MVTPAPGTRLGPYEITAKLGEGGMGVVYRAKDFHLGREVALKVLPEGFSADPDRVARFEREAKLLAQLNHPNIAQIHGLEVSGPIRALVMELVEGPTLAERLEKGALPLNESLSIARQIAEALEEAHEKGIVHRDLKPQNIKASIEGKVKVLDFGLAKAMDPAGNSAALPVDFAHSPTITFGATREGVILGTAAYMSPEQARGGAIDKRADIWAFGVVVYEMLTGERLFSGESVVDVLGSVMRQSIDFERLPATTPSRLRELVRRCLERNPKNRLRDIGDARLVIEEMIARPGEASELPTVAAVGSDRPRPWLAFAAVALVAAALGIVLGGRIPGLGRSTAPPIPAWRFQKLSFLPGVEWAPELSADGKTLFFVAGEATRSEIYSVPVGGKKPTSLTPGSDAYHDSPRLSPDGSRLVFASTRDGGGIFVMGVNGESVRKLANRGSDPAWSPDGRLVAYSTDEFFLPYEGLDGGTIGLLDVAAGTTRELPARDAYQPAWSPSGRRIAYWALRGGGDRDLATIAVDGGEPVAVASHSAVDWNPVWSDDGRHLHFLSDRGGTMNLWRVAIDEATGVARGEPESVPLPADEVIYLARSGERWIYAGYSSRSSVQVVEFDAGRSAVVGVPRSLLSTSRSLREVAVSPDGTRIAFATMRPQEDVYVVATEGGAPTQLTDDPEFDRYVSWTPDGQRIVFSSFRGVKYEHYWIRPDGSGFQALTEIPPAGLGWNPLFSPGAERMVVSTASGVALLDTSGPPPWSRLERTAPPEGPPGTNFSGAIWSPDGSRLAGFVYRGRERRRAAVLDLATRSYRIFEPTSRTVGWFPDGRRVLIVWQGRLAVLDLASWRATPVSGSPELRGRVTASRDLRTLVSLEDDSQADIWLAEARPPA
ncbi:MAG: serine/threonine-protein kinase [Thermoanaerobaculia bacterium]|nr:serine/threonine-protein kinase [Thermoanaerobaculia bacterium]